MRKIQLFFTMLLMGMLAASSAITQAAGGGYWQGRAPQQARQLPPAPAADAQPFEDEAYGPDEEVETEAEAEVEAEEGAAPADETATTEEEAQSALPEEQNDKPAAPNGLQSKDVDAFLKTLKDDKERAKFISVIEGYKKTANVKKDPVVDMLGRLREGVVKVSTAIASLKNDVLNKSTKAKDKTSAWRKALVEQFVPFLLFVLGLFAVQYVIALIARSPRPPFFRRIQAPFNETYLRAVAPLAGVFLVGYVAIPFVANSAAMTNVFTKVLVLLVGLQSIMFAVRVAFSFDMNTLRPEAKQRLFTWFVGLGLAYVFIESTAFALEQSAALAPVVHIYSKLFHIVLMLLVVTFLFRQKATIRAVLVSEEAQFSPFIQQAFITAVHYLHVLLSVSVLAYLWCFLIEAHASQLYIRRGLMITIGLLLANKFVTHFIETYVKSRIKALTTYHSTVLQSVQNTMLVTSFAFVAYYWFMPLIHGVGIGGLFAFEKIINFALIVLVASVTVKTLHTFVESKLNPIDNYGMLVAPSPRVKTFLPLLNRIGTVVIYLVAGLLALSELGVDISPLLAGLGVFGLALSLGTQNIIKDFMSGLFILAENDFNVGDSVEIDGIEGLVEETSFRHVVVRDLKGGLRMIPYGNIKVITNNSREFNVRSVKIPLMNDQPLSDMVKLYDSVATQMLENTELQKVIIDVPAFIGVAEIKPQAYQDPAVAALMEFRYKTKPGSAKKVGQEFLRLAKMAQEEIERYNEQ